MTFGIFWLVGWTYVKGSLFLVYLWSGAFFLVYFWRGAVFWYICEGIDFLLGTFCERLSVFLYILLRDGNIYVLGITFECFRFSNGNDIFFSFNWFILLCCRWEFCIYFLDYLLIIFSKLSLWFLQKKILEFTCLKRFNNLFDENFEKSIEIYLLKKHQGLNCSKSNSLLVFVDLFQILITLTC